MSEHKTYTIADIQKEIRTLKLDEEEQELLLASYNEPPKSASNKAELLKLSRDVARNTLNEMLE